MVKIEKKFQEVIEKKVVELREFIKGLPEEVQHIAANRIAREGEILELFSSPFSKFGTRPSPIVDGGY